MKKTMPKPPTVRKVINFSDEIIDRIDNEALNDYTSRPEFVATAVRNLTDQLINRWCIEYEMHASECKDALKMDDFIYELVRPGLAEMKTTIIEYDSGDYTPVTLIVTEKQLEKINYFIRVNGPIKNMQEYCRIATIRMLDNRMELYKTRWSLTNRWAPMRISDHRTAPGSPFNTFQGPRASSR